MGPSRDVAAVLNRDFLETRGRILELAAALDRIDRANPPAGVPRDPRLDQMQRALEALLEAGPSRAESVQRIFSLDYDPQWQAKFGLAARRP